MKTLQKRDFWSNSIISFFRSLFWNLHLDVTTWNPPYYMEHIYNMLTNYHIYNFSTLLSGVFIFLIGKDTIKITIIETNSSHVSTGKYYRWLKIIFSVVKIQNSGAVLMSIGLFWTFCVVCFCCYPKDFDDPRMRFSSENCIPICETVQFINGELILFIDFEDLLPKSENSKFEDQKSLIGEDFYTIY